MELIFMPAPAIGHLVSMVEMAKLLINRCKHLSITVLVTKFPIDTGIKNYTESLVVSPTPRLTIINLPETDPETYIHNPKDYIFPAFIDSQKPSVRDVVTTITRTESTRIAGFVVDFLCITIIDIANEFKSPTYMYSPAGGGFLGTVFHLQNQDDLTEFKDSEAELVFPSFVNPLPANVLPSMFMDKESGSDLFLALTRRFREAKGIVVNTFVELEAHAINVLVEDSLIPPVYCVGPLLNLAGESQKSDEAAADIFVWLDHQPASSVLFLCFGSFGSFPEDQVREIALALEYSGHRFLWSLRPRLTEGETNLPQCYSNLEQVLPPGFLDRTSTTGKVIGWAPQVAVLSHPAVGGFMSHCGWNSTLESVWFGVPVAAWPIYAEQQLNAFEMVTELGLAVDIKMDYSNLFNLKTDVVVVKAEEIEIKIRKLMTDENMRKKVKKMKEKSRIAMSKNGSSYTSLGKLIDDITL